MYAQVTQLFSSAPDLLEDFKQFLPESAAQAKAQAAAKQASEDAAMLSNVRGDSGFGTGLQQAQVQTPRPDIKMPPVGNFAPPSATKENKTRRGGPGSQMTGGAAAIDTGAGPSALNNRNGGARGNANKVSIIRCSAAKNPFPHLHMCCRSTPKVFGNIKISWQVMPAAFHSLQSSLHHQLTFADGLHTVCVYPFCCLPGISQVSTLLSLFPNDGFSPHN